MKTNQTFTMIKPDAVGNGHIGAILNKIAEASDLTSTATRVEDIKKQAVSCCCRGVGTSATHTTY